jgi:hypothetical protein
MGQPRPAGNAPSPSFTPNLPAGLSLVYDTQFETPFSIAPPGTEISYEGTFLSNAGSDTESATSFSTTRVTSTGGYGNHAVRFRYPQGSLGGGVSPGKMLSADNLGYRRLYAALRVFFSAGYEVHDVNPEKFLRPVTNGNSIAAITELYRGGAFAGLANPSATFAAISASGVWPINAWFTVEILWEINSPSSSNGTRKIWVDGVLVTNQIGTQMFYDSATQQTFRYLSLENERGGGDATIPVPSGGQWRDFNRVAVYGSVT